MTAKTLAACVLAAALAVGCSSSHGNKYSKGKALLGVVELGPFPKAPAATLGYSLYMAEKPDGPFKRINHEVILPLTSLMVPYLNVGQEYYFKMSAHAKGTKKEGAQGAVFARKAAANKR